jgi:hypothetical protein
MWQLIGDNAWWLTDFSGMPGTDARAAWHGAWQAVPYQANTFAGVMIQASPLAAAPPVRVPMPRELQAGRYRISVGMLENYSDRVLLKLDREPVFDRLGTTIVPAMAMAIQDAFWRDVEVGPGDALMVAQDNAVALRAAVAYVRIAPAPEALKPEIPLLVTSDGWLSNYGRVSFEEMVWEQLAFADTHVSAFARGSDACGAANYLTKMPSHRLRAEDALTEEFCHPDSRVAFEQYLAYEKAGRCPLRDAIAAAHSIGRELYAYHRMAILSSYPPFHLFRHPMYDEHPEWRCVDFDGTPVSRLSICYDPVRRYFLEHFRETVELGADGVCLVFVRGVPMVLFEKPVAQEFKRRTGREMSSVEPTDRQLWRVRVDFFTDFLRQIRSTVGASKKIVALVPATPALAEHFAMDCGAWTREGLIDTLCPYSFDLRAQAAEIDLPAWKPLTRETLTRLCPVLNTWRSEPAMTFLDRAEQWIAQGADGLASWDAQHKSLNPEFRHLMRNIASAEGRARVREILARGPERFEMRSIGGVTVDRYPPGWNC